MAAEKRNLAGFFEAKSYALVGASNNVGTLGWCTCYNFKNYFTGKYYFVNVKGGDFEGVPFYKSIAELPETPEAALILISAKACFAAAKDLMERGTRYITIASGGFAEEGPAGKKLQDELLALAKKYDTRIIGPNCIGVENGQNGLNSFFIPAEFEKIPFGKPGSISIFAQSGGLTINFFNLFYNMFPYIWEEIRRAVSYGNACDVGEIDLLDFYGKDENTKLILDYTEGLSNPALYFKVLREVSKKKPVISIKSGRYAKSQAAAVSHTASMAANDRIVEYLMKQAGSTRVFTWKDLIDNSVLFHQCPLPKGRRIAIVTQYGGNGVMGSDAAMQYKLEMPSFTPQTLEAFYKKFPKWYSAGNPMDLTADLKPETFSTGLEFALKDDNIDMVAFFGPGLFNPDPLAEQFKKILKDNKKPFVWMAYGTPPPFDMEHFRKLANDLKVPFYTSPEECMHGLAMFADYAEFIRNEEEKAKTEDVKIPDFPREEIVKIFEFAKKDGRTTLLEPESRQVCKLIGIPTPLDFLAKSGKDAAEWYNKNNKDPKNPMKVVLKIVSPQVIHKTDEGGVIVGVKSAEDVQKHTDALLEKFKNRDSRGIIISEMVPNGTEMLIGGLQEPAFGPIVVAGIGGAMTEVFDDVSYNMCPTNTYDAMKMITNLKNQKIVKGFRGSPAVNIPQFAEALKRMSKLLAEYKDLVGEVDLNPIIFTKDSMYAVDARMVIKKEAKPVEVQAAVHEPHAE